jgi:DNA polymerase IV
MSASRIACVNLPHIAVALEERENRALIGRPMAVEAPQPGPRVVYDLSYPAHLSGVVRGMALAQARKVCPEIVVVPARPDLYRGTFQAMIEVLATFTPAVEPADLEHSWLAAEGATAGMGVERALAAEMAGKVRHEVGLHARVGLAHGKLTSRIVTEYLEQRHVMVLPPGKEVSFLGGLATRYLPLLPDNHQRLTQLGLTKVHQYAALPARGILPRFGYDGLRAYRLAHGRDESRVRAWQEEPFVEAAHAFLEPIANLRSLHYHVEQLVMRVARPLAARFQMAGALALTITFENGAVTTERRTLAEPVMSQAALLTHADALLSRFNWVAPVERLVFGAQGLCPTLGRQLDLFRREQDRRADAEETLRRIQMRFGTEVVQQGHALEPASPLHERRAYLAPWGA